MRKCFLSIVYLSPLLCDPIVFYLFFNLTAIQALDCALVMQLMLAHPAIAAPYAINAIYEP